MSGIEVASLILGVLPVLFAAVDIPKDGFQRALLAFRKRIYVRKLAHALLLHKQTIAENMKLLATASGCDDIWLVDDDPLGYLNDKRIQEQILDYLGTENHAAIVGILEQSCETTKKIARNITGLLPSGTVRYRG